MGASAKARVEREFTVEGMARAYETVFSQLAR
jgi:hypothetical protein